MFLVLEFLMPNVLMGVESTAFGRKLRNMFGENEAVKRLTFRDIFVLTLDLIFRFNFWVW
jgi:hypothetical protein